MQGSSFEKAVVIISMILIVFFIGFAFHGHVNVPILEDSQTEKTQDFLSSQSYAKTTSIHVERSLQGQSNVTEDVNVETIINQEDGVARQEVDKKLQRGLNVIKKTNELNYIVEDNSSMNYSDDVLINDKIPVMDFEVLNSFKSSEDGTRTIYTAREDEFVGLEPYDVSKHITSQEFDSVDYLVTIDQRDRVRGYEIVAESESESIIIETEYIYNSGSISSETPTVNQDTLTYNYKSTGFIDVYSSGLENTTTVLIEDQEISLKKGENVTYSGVDRITFSDNGDEHEHLIKDEIVIKSILVSQ